MSAGRWLLRAASVLAIAAAVHLVTVWALPRGIMRALSNGLDAGGAVMLPPMTDATSRRVVMPSPDLLYALCAYDVSDVPMRIQADPKPPGYWSIALYASNSDNYFVLNDRRNDGRPVDLLLTGPASGTPATPVPEGATRVASPTPRGVLLMRVLVADYAAQREQVEAARRTLRCTPLR